VSSSLLGGYIESRRPHSCTFARCTDGYLGGNDCLWHFLHKDSKK
jgi:hypothetical protein